MFSDLGLCFPRWHSDQIPSHGKMVRDSGREKKAYSSLLRDGIKSRCLLQRLSRMSWNQEMTVAPGMARLPQDTRGQSEASIGCVCQAYRVGWGLPSNRNPGFICNTKSPIRVFSKNEQIRPLNWKKKKMASKWGNFFVWFLWKQSPGIVSTGTKVRKISFFVVTPHVMVTLKRHISGF